MNELKYSVLMSVYYKENPKYFRLSLMSILEQTVKPDEIIIVKDGPLNSELEKVLNDFAEYEIIKIIELETNKGLGEALNIGIKNCTNEIIARMDTDDIAKKDRCEKQLNVFKANKNLDILSSFISEFSNDINCVNSIKKVPITHEEIVKYARRRNPFNHPAVMYKKSAVINAGGYKHFELFEDYYLWVRMIMNGAKCSNINECLLYMRANEDMFKRRGGYKYLKCIIKFKWHLKKIGFYSINDFIISSISQGLVSIIPNKIRIIIYKKLLRN